MPFNTPESQPETGDGGLIITRPHHYQVVQRNLTTNKGTITVSGTFTGTTRGIEARWAGGAWQMIDHNPDDGSFSGTLTDLTPGQGELEVRFVDSTSNARKKLVVGVGDVFVLAGQSNCVGGFENFQTYTNTLTACFFSKGYEWKAAEDPMHYNDGDFDSVYGAAGANGSSGSYWPLLADHMMDAMEIPVAFIPCAKVGINITEFLPGEDHLDRSTLYGAMLYRIIQAGGVRAIFWHQGETNVNDSQATYFSRLSTFATAIADDAELYTRTRLKFYPAKLQEHATNGPYTNLNLAVQQFWDEHSDAGVGADLSGIVLTTTPPEDGLHLTTDAQAVSCAAAWDDAFTNEGFYTEVA